MTVVRVAAAEKVNEVKEAVVQGATAAELGVGAGAAMQVATQVATQVAALEAETAEAAAAAQEACSDAQRTCGTAETAARRQPALHRPARCCRERGSCVPLRPLPEHSAFRP